MGALALFHSHFDLGQNESTSLPGHHYYITAKNTLPQRGDYVVFRWHGGGPHDAGEKFLKIVAGVPGDTITREGRNFYVNGQFVGTAKERSLSGQPLDMSDAGTLGQGEYYVMATSPNSLDSRYKLTGWIKQSEIIGKAYTLF
jgi:conjugal transfer pilin signal peptidase TrbI